MHTHSHPMLCLPFPGRRSTSGSVRLPSLACSLSLWAPEAAASSSSSSLVLISPELIEFSFLWESSQEGRVRREKSDRKNERHSVRSVGRSPGGRALPEVGSHQFPGGRWVRPLCTDLYLYPLNSHPSALQGRPIGWWSGSAPPPTTTIPSSQESLPPNLSSLCLQS